MTKCKYCKAEKSDSEMSVWAGKPSKVCVECKKDHPNGGSVSRRANGAASRPKAKAATKRKAPPKPDLAITVPGGGHGFTAAITDEDMLLITQENANRENDDDNVLLTRHEARQMFDMFGEWIVTG